jgi:hypothetical protein
MVIAKRPDIFLCHSSGDKETVRKLAEDLRKLGINAWFDAWEIRPGDSLIEKISHGIEQSAYFAAVLSSNSKHSKWRASELESVLADQISSGKRTVIPVIAEATDVPVFLKSLQYIDLTKGWGLGLLRLCGVLLDIPAIDIDRYTSRRPQLSLRMVRGYINRYQRNRVYIGHKDWAELQRIFGEHNITFGHDIIIEDIFSGQRYQAC